MPETGADEGPPPLERSDYDQCRTKCQCVILLISLGMFLAILGVAIWEAITDHEYVFFLLVGMAAFNLGFVLYKSWPIRCCPLEMSLPS